MSDPSVRPPGPHGRLRGRGRARTAWELVGLVIGVVFAVLGLALVGLVIFVVVGMNDVMGNK